MKCQGGSHLKKERNVVKAAFVMKGMFSNLLILLKQKSILGKNMVIIAVTPCVGVWIEITQPVESLTVTTCHSLRGSVD